MKNKFLIPIILILMLCISGCSTIHVGGSGRIGDVSGSGEVNIPIPKNE